jgi:hypothetical protein
MTDMAYEDFALPSALPGGGGTKLPGLTQLKGRLVHVMPTAVEHGVTSELKKEPHTRLTCDVTFLDGDPIGAVVNGLTQVATPLTPPVMPGQTMQGLWISQAWFVSRLKGRVGQLGFPGIIGVVGSQPTGKGAPMIILTDPTPAQVETVKGWFAWKNANPGQGIYVPAAPATPVTPPVAFAQPAPVAQAAPAAAPLPYGGSPAQPVAPANPFAQPVAPPAAPAPATGAPVPPWQQ